MTETETTTGYGCIDEIRRRNIGAGYHFFDPGTMRSFGSKVYDDLYGGRIFITSEQDRGPRPYGSTGAWGGQRRYTVRIARDDGSIGELSAFGQFDTLAQARRHAAAMRDETAESLARQAAALLDQAAELADVTGLDETDGEAPAPVLRRLHYAAEDVARKIERGQ